MRFGCCGSMVSAQDQGTGIGIIEQLEKVGYDYIELSLAHIVALSRSEYADLKARVDHSGLKCEACNNFYPASVRLTGRHVDWAKIEEYTAQAVERAAQLGTEIIVFGSAGAKNVPQGFPVDEAWKQIVEVLRVVAPIADRHGITIAIEHLNRSESNIVNSLQEGLTLAREVDRSSIKLLVDYYHLILEGDDPATVLAAGDYLRHVHFARVEGRVFPTEVEAGFRDFFSSLNQVGYGDRVSVEAYTSDFGSDAVRALAVLRQLE